MGSISLCESLQTEHSLAGSLREAARESQEIQSMRKIQPTAADFKDERGHRSGNVSSLLKLSIPSQQSARK